MRGKVSPVHLLTKWLNKMVKKKKIRDGSAEEKILAAARKVFTMKGMTGARMQDIADEAGINKALLHYYFRDKEKLFETIFVTEAQRFFPKINQIFISDAPLFEKIENFVNEYIDEMQVNPYLPWFVMNEINRDPDQFITRIWGEEKKFQPEKFMKQIETEIKAGRIKPVHPAHLFLNLIGMTIFPFVAKPMITRNIQVSDARFRLLMEERRKEIPQFIIDSIKK